MNFQVADVTKTLLAASGMNEAGYDVHLSRRGSYIECEATQKRTPLRQSMGVYFLDLWMKPGDHIMPMGFPRQAP